MQVMITQELEQSGRALQVDGKFFATLDSCAVVMKYTVCVGDAIFYTTFDEDAARRFAAAYAQAEIFAQLTVTTPHIEI